MRNKVLAVILVLTMAIGLTAFVPSSAQGVVRLGSDVVMEAAQVLMTLNIIQGYEDGSLRLENNITRAEFAAMLARMLKGTDDINLNAGAIISTQMSELPDNPARLGETAFLQSAAPGAALVNVGASYYSTDIDSTDLADPSFYDVSELHWAYTDVEYLRGQGIVTGYSDGTFRPDNNITYEEAVKFVTSALGYDFMAVSYGGYPEGYIKAAAQVKLLKNVNGTLGVNVTRQQVMLLLFNALTADYLVLDSIRNNLNVYETGKSILKYIFDVDTMEGYVLATEDSGMYSLKAASDKGTIEIGDDVLRFHNDSYKSYLGYKVKAYVRYDDETSNLGDLLVMIPSANTRMITVNVDDIKDADITGSSSTLNVYIDNTETTLKIDADPVVVYNDVAYGRNLTNDSFSFDSGDVTLISTKGTNVYDLIYINSYVPMYVKSVRASDKTITGSIYTNGQTVDNYTVNLNEDDDKYDITVSYRQANGAAASFDDIQKDSVVYIKMWGNHYNVELGGQTVSGTISRKGADYVIVNGLRYEQLKDSGLLKALSGNDFVKLGLTKEGYVFYTSTQASGTGLSYGLLMNINLNTKSGFGEALQIKLMDSGGQIRYYTASDNMKFTTVSGITYRYNNDGKSNSISYNRLRTELMKGAQIAGPQASASLRNVGSTRPYEQVVKYTVSGSEVTELLLARLASSVSSNDEKSQYFTVESTDVSGSAHHINKGTVYCTPYNVAMAIAFNVSKSSKPDDTDYTVGSIGMGARDGSHGIVLFDVAEDGVATCVLTGNSWTKSGTSTDFNRTWIAIEYMQEATIERSEDRDDVYEIGYINNGAYEQKYSLIENINGYDYFHDSAAYHIGDIMNPSYWKSGYWYGHYSSTSYRNGGKDDGEPFVGFYGIEEMLGRIIEGSTDQYFHYVYGTENYGSWEEELTFGKVRKSINGKVIVDYGENDIDATVCDIEGRKAVLYDCATGYVKVVSAEEVAEGDYIFLQQKNKAFAFMMIYTNVDEASLANIKTDGNDRK